MKKVYIAPIAYFEDVEGDEILLQVISNPNIESGAHDHEYEGPGFGLGEDDEDAAAKGGSFDFEEEF